MIEEIIKELQNIYPCYNIGNLDDKSILNKPFFVCESSGIVQLHNSQYEMFSVYIYAPVSAPLILDATTKKLINSLHKKTLKKKKETGYFYLEVNNVSGDFLDKSLSMIFRIVELKAPNILYI